MQQGAARDSYPVGTPCSCLRCGKPWRTRQAGRPPQCPNCHSSRTGINRARNASRFHVEREGRVKPGGNSPLENDGDLFGGDRGSVMKGWLHKARKNAAAPKPRKKREPVVEPLLSKAPYKQRIKDLLLATGWSLTDEDFGAKWGYSSDTVRRQINGAFPANVLFVRRLVRLEAMFEAELRAVREGKIRMAKVWGKSQWVRKDLRPGKGVVEDKVRGL